MRLGATVIAICESEENNRAHALLLSQRKLNICVSSPFFPLCSPYDHVSPETLDPRLVGLITNILTWFRCCPSPSLP